MTAKWVLPFSQVLMVSLAQWAAILKLDLQVWETSAGIKTFEKGVVLSCRRDTDERVKRAVAKAKEEELRRREQAGDEEREESPAWVIPGHESHLEWNAATQRGAHLVRFAARAIELQEKWKEKR